MINARSETVSEKPAFRSAYKRRRCLVPADGFYEWKKEGVGEGGKTAKVPYWIHLAQGEPFTFAGLWEKWEGGEGDPVYSFTILTTQASPGIREIHPRMPVILSREGGDRWLQPEASPEELQTLLQPYTGQDLKAYPVSTLVNSPRNDLPACIAPRPEGD
jgi:putative SOS response-associated peptidase YedK